MYGAKYVTGDPLPTFADAALLEEFPGDVHGFPVDPDALYRIWVKFVSRDGVPSQPAGGTNGFEPVPGLLDDVNIVNLTASRIRSGSVTVGQFIQAANYVPGLNGWRINGDGTAELSGVVVRGTVYASAGLIGGVTIASNAVLAGQTAFDTGNGFHLGADGKFSLGNGTQRLTWDGSGLTIKGALDGATGTFSGALSAATGTFSGSLAAATGTFSGSLTTSAVNAVNTINLAGNSVTVSVSASSSSHDVSVGIDCGSIPTTVCVMATTSGWIQPPDGTVTNYLQAALLMDGVVQANTQFASGTYLYNYVRGYGNGTFNKTFTGLTGVHTFRIYISDAVNAQSWGAGSSGIIALGVKR